MKSKTNYKVLNDCRGLYEEETFEIILKERGIEDINAFLNPTEDALLPLDGLKNINKAYDRLKNAIVLEENIGVYWDSDCDGITSGAIMSRYLSKMTDKEIHNFIPQGKRHGLAKEDLRKFSSIDLLIIVDSLDNTIDQYEELKNTGTSIIILDHHSIDSDIPYDDYVILVSSQREYDNPALSGAGVTWKFCKYIDDREGTNYADNLVDLTACGLIADMMDMTSMENRYIVSKGLEKINNPAIKKIIGSFEFNSTAISFSISPLVNAANRMEENEIAMQAFLTDDNKTVLSLVKKLKQCREDQRAEVNRLMPLVLEQCEKQEDKKMIVAFTDTPYGVNGLIANKVLEIYQRPILILKDIGDSYAGSMRAVGVDDFRQICNDSGLAQADGHELASGITIKKENFENFIYYIEETLPDLNLDSTVVVDVQLNVEDITRRMIDKIKLIDRISGSGFKPVKVLVDGITEYEIGQMSDYKHLVIKPNDYLNLIKWNFDGSFEHMEDCSMMNDELQIVASLDSGFLGRKFILKAICDDITEVC